MAHAAETRFPVLGILEDHGQPRGAADRPKGIALYMASRASTAASSTCRAASLRPRGSSWRSGTSSSGRRR